MLCSKLTYTATALLHKNISNVFTANGTILLHSHINQLKDCDLLKKKKKKKN